MAAIDPLDQVLKLVAEGKLTADEAGPILAALDEAAATLAASRAASETAGGAMGDRDSTAQRFATGFAAGFAGAAGDPSASTAVREEPASYGSGPTQLRIEVRDNGRNVVNLRLPIAVGKFALDRVPGLSGEQVDRVREAMRTGFRGPVLVVDDGDSGVRIVLD